MAVENQLSGALGISMTKIEDKSVTATLTVDHRHLRPGNIMNGGVSLVLIETVGSFSSYLLIDTKKQNSFGIQVSANHLSIARPGDVLTAKSEAVHLGRTTHIWDVNISNQNGKLVSSGRITMLVTDNPKS
ncbi:PaaI family thioesterase [Peredibacter sp. HCB2-198]|uniref:PaaI family thioesterase n=1 Tax=Peredibacter sp. HCB2-198 TaxID=3383025 RepID=UPI0038B59C59